MTKEVLLKAQELDRHIHYRNEDLKDIKYYEVNYSDYPVCLRIQRTKDDLFSDINIYDENLKKEILNIVKNHLINDIQKCKNELNKL